MAGFKQNKIHYSKKPIDAKESFWITAPREGYSGRCYSEWARRMRGTRFAETPTQFTDDSSKRRYSMRYGVGQAAVMQGKLRQGFALMGAE
jgi:hypothetical protein